MEKVSTVKQESVVNAKCRVGIKEMGLAEGSSAGHWKLWVLRSVLKALMSNKRQKRDAQNCRKPRKHVATPRLLVNYHKDTVADAEVSCTQPQPHHPEKHPSDVRHSTKSFRGN